MLVQEGVISQGQLGEALKRQAEAGGFIGQILVEMNYINQSTLVSFLVKQCKIPHISLVDYVVSEDLFKLVPKDLCLKHHLLPIDKLGRILTLAMVNPLDVDALEKIRSSCPDLKIKPILCDWNHFESVAKRVFHIEQREAQEVTAGSFGLSAQRIKKPAAVPAPEPTPMPAAPVVEAHDAVDAAVEALVREAEKKPARTAASAHEETAPVTPRQTEAARPARVEGGSSPTPHKAEDLRAAVIDAVGPLLAAQRAAPAADIAGKVGDSVRTVMKEALEPLLQAQRQSAAQADAAAQPDPKVLAEELRNSLKTAVAESLAPVLQAQKAGAGQQPSPDELAKLVTAGMHAPLGALSAEIRGLAEQQRQQAERAGATAQPDPKAWAEELRNSLKIAVAESLAPVLQAQKTEGAERQPSPEEWMKIVAAGMQAPLGALTAEIRTLAEQQRIPSEPQPKAEGGSALAEVLRGVLEQHESRLAEVAAAAAQAAQAAQAALHAVQEGQHDVEEGRRSKTRIANLEVFPGSGGDSRLDALALADSDALDSPGLGTGADERVREALDSDRLLGGYTFDQFLVGPQNTFTVKTARALGEKLARDFNPFFLYGEEGLGKTHLLNAIGNAVLKRNPDLRVAYVSASHFASSHAAAMKQDRVSEFRDRYCRWDMLLIDDVQFLAGHGAAQEELFHIFNALVHEGRLVVMAGDRAPDQLTDVQKGLTSRFSSGVVTRVRPPEMDIRLAILKSHATARRVAVPEEILTLIATRITSDVRKMTGALRKVLAYAKLVEQEITREMANEILDSLGIGEAA